MSRKRRLPGHVPPSVLKTAMLRAHWAEQRLLSHGYASPKDRTPLRPDDIFEAAQVGSIVARMVEVLRPRHRQCLEMRFGLGGSERHTLAETADALGISRSRASQIETQAMLHVRRGLRRFGITE